jgi:hypothetical protein
MTLFYKRANSTLFNEREYKIRIINNMGNTFFEWIGINHLKKSSPFILKEFSNYDRIPNIIWNKFMFIKNKEEGKKMKERMKMKFNLTLWRNKNPYLILFNNTNVFIYKENTDLHINTYNFLKKWGKYIFGENYIKIIYSKFVDSFNIKKIYIGKSHKCLTTKDSHYGKDYDGNTVLLYLGKKKYILINNNINKFKINDKCQHFVSPLTREKYSCPFIIGNNYIFFINEKLMVHKKFFPENMRLNDWYDSYLYFLDKHKGNECVKKYSSSF